MTEEKNCNFGMLCLLVVISLLLSIGSFIASIYAVYTLENNGGAQGGKVVISTQYDKGKSYEKALKTKKPVIVFFYTDWCGFCQRFVPTYHKVSKDRDIKKNFAIAYVNCEKSENSDLMKEFNINAFPTVYVVKDSNRTQIENPLLFQPEAVKIIKEKALEAIK